MKKIDDLTNEELAEYLRSVFEQTGPYQIDNWHMYQLKHTPTQSAIEKVEKLIARFEFNEEDEFLIAFRATKNHIRNMMLNMTRKIEDNTSEFNEIFTEIKKDIEDGNNPIS
jgi:hypothetical protein